MIRFDKYKPSEIDLLDEIPKDWKVNRLKALGDIRYGLGQPPKQMENGLPIIRATNVSCGKITTKDMLFVDPNDLPYDRKPILKTNEIIVVRSGAYTGDSAIIPEEYAGSVTGYDMVFTPKNINPKFIAFSILSNYIYKDQLVISSLRAAQPHLNKEELGNTLVSIPPLSEQNAIATYLDSKTFAIDRKVSLLEQKITHYQQLRKSLINETVCRGLDKTVKLKDSGIEFIGMIPEHWVVKRVKELFETSRGRVIGQNELIDNGKYPVYSSQTENDGCLGYIETYDFNKTLITWTTDGVNAGTVFKRSGKFNCTNICGTLTPIRKNVNVDFMTYAVQESSKHNKRIDTNGAKIMSNEMRIINIIYPPLSEQVAIANYLDEKTQKIDSIVSNIKTQIETLKELRKTLINDVVTGKIKV